MTDPLPFNESQQRRILSNAEYADRLLSDIEAVLASVESGRLFQRHQPDLTPQQARLVRSSIALFRRNLGRFLEAAGVGAEVRRPRFGALHSILVTLAFVRVALQELAPEHLRGYGALGPEAESALRGVSNQLEALISTLEGELRGGAGADLQARLERVPSGGDLAHLLRTLDRVIAAHELPEFRPALTRLVEKLESPSFEVAAFGRVSSGKSSLINRLLGAEVLPVGVTPVTAVPVRLLYGETASLTVSLAGGRSEEHSIGDLPLFATEEHNPGNRREVMRLIVRVPSPLLKDGVVFVDTPGLGSLAAAGAAESLSYLPRCDLGLVLVSAVTPLNEEDVATVDLLLRSGTPAMVLLSKADLLGQEDLERALRYTETALERELGTKPPVRAVSVKSAGARLLETWIKGELEPVLARHKELAVESLHRKADSLRSSVAAVLRGRLERAGTAVRREALEQAETVLRDAWAGLETARRDCEAACLALRGRKQEALRLALRLTAAQQDGRDPHRAAQALREAALRVCDASAGEVKDRLEKVCAGLAAALETALGLMRPGAERAGPEWNCASISGLPVPSTDSLPEAVRMPAAAGLPWIGPGAALAGLDRQAGQAVQRALETHARSLEAWLRQRLEALQEQFDAEAGVLIAEIARTLSAETGRAEQDSQIAESIEELERAAPQKPASASRPDGGQVTPAR